MAAFVGAAVKGVGAGIGLVSESITAHKEKSQSRKAKQGISAHESPQEYDSNGQSAF